MDPSLSVSKSESINTTSPNINNPSKRKLLQISEGMTTMDPLHHQGDHDESVTTAEMTSIVFDDDKTADYSEVSWRGGSTDTWHTGNSMDLLSTSTTDFTHRISVPKSFKGNIHVQELTINKLRHGYFP